MLSLEEQREIKILVIKRKIQSKSNFWYLCLLNKDAVFAVEDIVPIDIFKFQITRLGTAQMGITVYLGLILKNADRFIEQCGADRIPRKPLIRFRCWSFVNKQHFITRKTEVTRYRIAEFIDRITVSEH